MDYFRKKLHLVKQVYTFLRSAIYNPPYDSTSYDYFEEIEFLLNEELNFYHYKVFIKQYFEHLAPIAYLYDATLNSDSPYTINIIQNTNIVMKITFKQDTNKNYCINKIILENLYLFNENLTINPLVSDITTYCIRTYFDIYVDNSIWNSIKEYFLPKENHPVIPKMECSTNEEKLCFKLHNDKIAISCEMLNLI